MKRLKKHIVKVERPEASTSHSRLLEEYDLTYYVHDRVELMHQVFSILRHKDLKIMAPECVRHISIDNLQELCTEELLGISSKRLCAILDGAEPPSDSESSSESLERMETISLDSISSDEEILSEASSRKSKKHKHHQHPKSKSKKKKDKESNEAENPADADKMRASRAGLTVLELLELQARARAIRAQLHQDQAAKQAAELAAPSSPLALDNDVEIKEEPAEVVEISSEDEKPKIEEFGDKTAPKSKEAENPRAETPELHTVTKRTNDLIITVPQPKQSKRIKLNRSKIVISVDNNKNNDNSVADDPKTTEEVNKTKDVSQNETQTNNTEITDKINKERQIKIKEKEKPKEKNKKQKKVKKNTNQDSDHDEITLQLSDTEKMDLLEDLDRKNFEKLCSSNSEDSDTSSSDSESRESDKKQTKTSSVKQNDKHISKEEDTKEFDKIKDIPDADSSVNVLNKGDDLDKTVTTVEEVTIEKSNETEMKSLDNKCQEQPVWILDDSLQSKQSQRNDNTKSVNAANDANDNNIEIISIQDIPIIEDEQNVEPVSVENELQVESVCVQNEQKIESMSVSNSPIKETVTKDSSKEDTDNKSVSQSYNTKSSVNSPDDVNADRQTSLLKISVQISSTNSDQAGGLKKRTVRFENNDEREAGEENVEKYLSDGELSDKHSSDIEAVELQSEVVYISDDDTDKKSRKKKKKEKKSKSKKSKKPKKDFHEGDDENFYKNTVQNKVIDQDVVETVNAGIVENTDKIIKIEEEYISLEAEDNDDVHKVLEWSDDSSRLRSLNEIEGTVLSKEPTTEEIDALSTKIDEIEREEVVTAEEIREFEIRNTGDTENIEELGNVSWKDRYLDSKKVKKVLRISGIFNALRKKNRELKKKLKESKKEEETEQEEKEEIVGNNVPVEGGSIEEISIEQSNIEEGSIEQYNTLEGSTKYVDPVPEIKNKTDNGVQNGEKKNGVVVTSGKDGQNRETKNKKSELAVTTAAMATEIKKDANQLFKMYKRLMRYADNKPDNVNKPKDLKKKKRKRGRKKNNVVFIRKK